MSKEVKQYNDGCLMTFVIIILVIVWSMSETLEKVMDKLDRLEDKIESVK